VGITRARVRRELIHPGVPEDVPRRVVVVPLAEDPAVLDGRCTPEGTRLEVVDLAPSRRAADAAAERPLAPPSVALPPRAPHVRGDVAGDRGGGRRGSRLLHEPAALRVPLDDEVEPRLEDVRDARGGEGVRERVPRLLELLREALLGREVNPDELRGERLDC
jgi:hypothetical protein